MQIEKEKRKEEKRKRGIDRRKEDRERCYGCVCV
jgi:hypothetical protein